MLLTATDYGTIKGDDDFEEIRLSNFINTIDAKVNSFYKRLNGRTLKYSIEHYAIVLDDGDNNYRIFDGYVKYLLKLDEKNPYYPELKKHLDKLVRETQIGLNKERTINDLEQNENVEEHNNKEDLEIYLQFLNERRRKHLFQFINNLIVSGMINVGILLFVIVNCFVSPHYSIIFLGLGVLGNFLINKLLDTNGVYERLINSFKLLKILKYKIKGTEKKMQRIQNVSIKVNSQVKDNLPKKDYYKETIYGYIGSLSKAIEKIDQKDSHGIYVELRDILDEYEAKMIKLNETGGKGLSFDNSKQAIMQHAINRLQELELQVAEIMKRNNKNKEIINEGVALRESLNRYIESTSQGQVEVKPKVRTRSKED